MVNFFSVNENRLIFLRKLSVIVIFIFTFYFPGISQGGSDSLLNEPTLPNIIQYALKKQPIIRQAQLDETITELQIKSKLSDWYPQVNFNYLYQHNFLVQTSVIGGNPVKLGVENTSALQFSATQNVFNRDVLLASQTKNIVRQQVRQQTENSKIDLVANVSKAFYDVLATKQQIQVADETILRLQKSLKDATAQYNAGVVDKTDYKRATIALNNALASKKSVEEALQAKTEYLKALINYPQAAALNIIADSIALENQIGLDTLAAEDYSKRIEYKILETQHKLQEANVKYNKWNFIPSVSANGAYNLNYLNNSFGKLYDQSYPNSYAGLTLSFPIFQGGKRKYNIQQAEWELKRSELDIENFKNQAHSEYNTALANYKSSLADYLSMKENELLAKEVYDVIQLQYHSGVKAYLEVITAETDLRSAEINYFDALFHVISSKIDVLKSKGEIKW